jgi:LAO/AO transport system kinase
VVSKADRSDANRTLADLKMMLKDQMPRHGGWRPPVVGVSSLEDEGFEALLEALAKHKELMEGPDGQERRKAIAAFRLAKTAETLALEKFRRVLDRRMSEGAKALAERREDPYHMADAIVGQFAGDEKNG